MFRPRMTGIVFSLVLCLTALAAFGQESPGVVATFTGSLSNTTQQDRISFEVTDEQYQVNDAGEVDFVFLMSSVASAGAPVDPGLISIEAMEGGSVQRMIRKPDTATTTASIAIASLTPGNYEIVVRSEHKTIGPYRLDVLLAGDVNTDYKVDITDLQLIEQLKATKKGDKNYSEYADVDRNGVINGGDRQRADANLGTEAIPPQTEDNPLDQSLPAGALTLVDASTESFVSRTRGLRFSLNGAEFDPVPAETILTINGTRVSASQLVFAPNLLTANITLFNGKNTIFLKAYDTIGRPLYYNATLWAGSATLRVNLVNPDGTAFSQQANVVAALADDPGVTAQGITTNGTITFTNVPSRTIIVKANGINNEIGTAGIVGGGTVTIKMIGFNAPSTIDNNDLSLGKAGWVATPGSPVWIVPHKESIPGFTAGTTTIAKRMGVTKRSIVDQDIILGTSGEGVRNLSRTPTTSEGTTAVKIRYRFITSEVPGGWFGSAYNDYFFVSLRSEQGCGAAYETNSMNGLGLGSFNYATGETDWREIMLQTDPQGDTIQADIAVANVGDGWLDSQVVVDFVEEINDQVFPALAWNNQQGGLTLTWEVLDDELENDVVVEVYFADGTGYANRLGTTVFMHMIPSGTQPGAGGPINVPGVDLENDPANTTHLIAASSPSMIGSVPDVRIVYGPNADPVVAAEMIDIVKDGLRAAGASIGTITSTLRTAADQARAMFNNCFNTGTAGELALYGAAGEAVIQVYIAQTQGLTPEQIQANSADIRAAMEAEIIAQGPENVSAHCGDPMVRSVVDLSYNSFNATNRPLFSNAVSGRVTDIIDEPAHHCFHLLLVL